MKESDKKQFEKLVNQIRTVAKKRGDEFELIKLTKAQVQKIAGKVKPEFGKFHFTPPPSYEYFLTTYGILKAGDDDGKHVIMLWDQDEMKDENSELVHVPKDVTWGKEGQYITTNHLAAFAGEGDEDEWCFYTDAVTSDGELPVYLHNQDRPAAAKFIKTGEWVDKKGSKPTFKNFLEWLKFAVKNYTKGKHLSRGGYIVK